jgi:GGDEF domain-containing protein
MALHWQLRCAARRTAEVEASGQKAAALCEAVVETLGNPSHATHLSLAARSWASNVSNPAEARAALLCLCEVATELDGELATTELATTESATTESATTESATTELATTWYPDGLDAVLGALVAEAARVSTQADPVRHDATDALTGCPGRRALERDLGVAVVAAAAAGGDVAVATVQLDRARRHLGVVRPGGSRDAADDAAVLGLVATLRRSMGRADGLYRVGPTSFAVLAADTTTAGALALRAECLPGPKFSWGMAGLAAVGAAAVESPDLLLVVAEADRELRRRELARVDDATARRRRMSAVAAAAAAIVLVAGVTVGVGASSSAPTAHVHAALPAGAGGEGTGTPASASSGDRYGAHRFGSSSSSSSPGSSSPGATPLGPTPGGTAGLAPGTEASAASTHAPAPTNAPAVASLALFTRAASTAPPPAPAAAVVPPAAPTTSPPPPAATPAPPAGPGHSGSAPGHTKGHRGGPTHP